jgi:hypothetical protein
VTLHLRLKGVDLFNNRPQSLDQPLVGTAEYFGRYFVKYRCHFISLLLKFPNLPGLSFCDASKIQSQRRVSLLTLVLRDETGATLWQQASVNKYFLPINSSLTAFSLLNNTKNNCI